MSFASEAAFNRSPAGRHFDFSEFAQSSKRVLKNRIIPAVRDASVFTYKKTSAAGVLLLSPLFWLEENCGSNFDEARYPVPAKAAKTRKERFVDVMKYAGSSARAAVFLAVLMAPSSFSPRPSTVDEGGENILFVSESTAATPAEVPAVPRWHSADWFRDRARIQRSYDERREREHPSALVVPYEERQYGPMRAQTGFFSE